MKHKISCLILLLAQYAFAQMKPVNATTATVPQSGAVNDKDARIDSTVIKAVSLPSFSTGNPSNVFTDDTGCSRKYAVTQTEFHTMLQSVNVGTTDEARLLEAFRLARKSCLNASQIAQICKTFTHEKTRLEFAKFAFSACVDPKNYAKVSALLTRKSYLDDLRWYISGK